MKLGDSITNYLETGLKVAVTGFKSSDWAERNASTLLFSALMTRIFGVKREKEAANLSSKNCLTGKIFFQRYPSLYEFFLSQLSQSSAVQTSQSGVMVVDSAVYPVLLVLARILPAPSHSHSDAFPLSAFLPHVETARSSSILRTRQLAAAAIVPLLAEQKVREYLRETATLTRQGTLSQNALHGALLTIRQFLLACPQSEAVEVLLSELVTSDSVERLVRSNPCSLTCSASVNIFTMIVNQENLQTFATAGLTEALTDKMFDERETSSADLSVSVPADVWKPLLFREAATFLVKFSLINKDVGVIEKLLIHPEYEVRLAVIDHVKDHVSFESESNERLGSSLFNCLLVEKHPECLESLLTCCRLLPGSLLSADQFPFLSSLIETTTSDSIRAAGILLCSNLVVNDPEVEEDVLYELSLLLRDSLDSVNTATVRAAGVESLVQNCELLVSGRSRRAAVILWSVVIKLTGEQTALRDKISHIYQKITHSPTMISPDTAGERLLDLMMDTIGFSSPVSFISMAVGLILSPLVERGEQQEMSPEVDKAFDRNEMNCDQEIVGLALLVVPKVSSLVRRLSAKLQVVTFTTETEADLVRDLWPELWGAVRVYSLQQLVEYLLTRLAIITDVTENSDQLEYVVILLILSSLRCSVTEIYLGDKLTDFLSKLKHKTYFVKSLSVSLQSSQLGSAQG